MIQRRRAQLHETKTGHERWLVSYADFITLLFGFFVVMYSVSQVSEKKYRTLSDTMAQVFERRVPADTQVEDIHKKYPLDNTGEVSGLSPEVNLIDTETLEKELNDILVHLVEPNNVLITASEEWVQIDVNANILFKSASATPSEEAQALFKEVADVLHQYENEVEVAGHTDNIPIATAEFANNWALSAARSVSVVKLLSQNGIAPHRLSAVGFGEFRPKMPNDTAEGRSANRRVVLKVAKHRPPVIPYAPLKPSQEVPTSISNESTQQVNEEQDNSVQPVRLDNGGLLFSSDPELPRKNP